MGVMKEGVLCLYFEVFIRTMLFVLVLGFFYFNFAGSILATPPSSAYLPGETLDPTCSPGDANCSVDHAPGGATGNIQFNDYSRLGGEANFFYATTTGNVGIGTSSPYAKLAVSGEVVANLFTATSTTATSTLNGALKLATSGWGLEFPDGTIQTTASAGAGGSTLHVDGGGFVYPQTGDYHSSPYYVATSSSATSTFAGGLTIETSGFVYDVSTNNVGIANSSPAYKLDVTGFINTDQYSGYKQAGNTILYASSTNFSTLVGQGAGGALLAGGQENTAIGYEALTAVTTTDGHTAIGYRALKDNTTGIGNTAVGAYSLNLNIGGDENTALGYAALYPNTTGSYNTALGYGALTGSTVADSNTAIGNGSLYSNITGSENTAVGANSLYANITGTDNVAIGRNASFYNKSATSTVAIGVNAGYGAVGNSNQNGVLVGYGAGYLLLIGGDNNILLGYQSGDNLTSGDSNIVIGYDIDSPTATNSNTLTLGNLLYGTGIDGTGTTMSSGNIGIGTSSPYVKFSVAGSGFFGGNLTTSNIIATSTTATSTFVNASFLTSAIFPLDKTLTTAGQFTIDQTSGQVRFNDGTSQKVLLDEFDKSMFIASTTPDASFNIFNTATTSFTVWNPLRAVTATNLYCKTDTGTVVIRLGDGSNWSDDGMVCTSSGVNTALSSTNAFTARENVVFEIGTSGSSANGVTITTTFTEDAD